MFTCLSHEIVVHETTHALLDGLRERYMDPSSPQQAGFHEGFADIIALLSILSAQSVVEKLVDLGMPNVNADTIWRRNMTPENLRNSALLGLAQQMGSELSGIHGQALRRSVSLPPSRDYLESPQYYEPHTCGEVLVAAVLNAYLEVWINRLRAIGDQAKLDRKRAAEEGAELADRLLTVFVRAIDYCPPTDLQFCDFASGVLTADWELNPKDDKYNIRASLLKWFREFGIDPKSKGQSGRQEGSWDPPPDCDIFEYDRTHCDSMKSDPDELFRFLWENRAAFRLNEEANTRVLSVRPCLRTGRDGFVLHETVVEYHQQLTVFARELSRLDIRQPKGMPDDTEVTLYGGNAVIFDEFGQVKYNIGNSILAHDDKSQKRQSDRLQYLWDNGAFSPGASRRERFRICTGHCEQVGIALEILSRRRMNSPMQARQKTKPARDKRPSSVTIRMYNVGFGDCFLMSFHYASGDKHVLIDYGSTSAPKIGSANYMVNVAKDIKEVCKGKLDIVVATHRHQDHISGFSQRAPPRERLSPG